MPKSFDNAPDAIADGNGYYYIGDGFSGAIIIRGDNRHYVNERKEK